MMLTLTGHPASCDPGPELNGYGNMIYFNGEWATLTELNATLTYNWMIKALQQGQLDQEHSLLMKKIYCTKK